MNMKQQGFTLIELMIALVLGLIISAAVIQVYIMSVRTNTIQASSSNLQNASVFGFQNLENSIRLANLGNDITKINHTTPFGGIVLSTDNLKINANHLTKTSTDVNSSNINGVPSDQLTISYRNVFDRIMSDCEGNDVVQDTLVVERYFVSGMKPNLSLRCDAGHFTGTDAQNPTPNATIGLGVNDVEFVANVDQFKVLLGLQSLGDSPTITYMDPDETLSQSNPIAAVRIALISRGGTAILGETGAESFTVFGQTQTLDSGAKAVPQVRGTYESNILLRNARIIYTTGR